MNNIIIIHTRGVVYTSSYKKYYAYVCSNYNVRVVWYVNNACTSTALSLSLFLPDSSSYYLLGVLASS